MGFSKQGYWSGLPFTPPGDLPGPGIEPASPETPALAGGFFTTSTAWQVWHKEGLCKREPLLYCCPGLESS